MSLGIQALLAVMPIVTAAMLLAGALGNAGCLCCGSGFGGAQVK